MSTAVGNGQSGNLILGTAMWAWNIERKQCFHLLDSFYRAGFRQIDTATNYPINKHPADFRAAEKILLEWIDAHQVQDLEVIMKVGSINNLHTPDHQLSPSFLLLCLDNYQQRFGSNLHTFMIHWDNRAEEEEIDETLSVLFIAGNRGLYPGLSGIKHPGIYAALNLKYQLCFRIEIKHNLVYSDYNRYRELHLKNSFLAYGINGGGLKLTTADYQKNSTLATRGGSLENRALQQDLQNKLQEWNRVERPIPINSFNQIGLINAYYHSGITDILIGPSNGAQLDSTVDFYRYLANDRYYDVYQALGEFTAQH